MSTSFRERLLTALLIFFVVAAFPPPLIFADHSWGSYHWARQGNSFTLMLGDNVSAIWDEYLHRTSFDWNPSGVLETTVVPGRVTNPKSCKPTAGRVEVCSERYGNNGWLGIAQIWVSSGHITQAITKLNDTYFNSAKYNTRGWRNLVMCQEVGHTFGLDHQDETFDNGNMGTCMDYTNDPDGTLSKQATNEHPNTHDYEQLETIYNNHFDSTTTAGLRSQTGKVPPPFADNESSEPPELGTGQWGKLIRSTNRGRTELYELDLGAGRKAFTHVIWAEGEERGEGKGRTRR